jgi:di/tripeptidase
MLCEYRSDTLECLSIMKAQFERIFRAAAERDGVTVKVTLVGERPCMGNVDLTEIGRMEEICAEIHERIYGGEVGYGAASTDCNIPLSLGIPALCMGVYFGGGGHTREEWIGKDSLALGLEAAIRTAYTLMEGKP